ncbi:unnamed protein product [Urochloa humidicola]
MGNSLPLPPCVRHHDADEAEGAKKRRRKQRSPPACRSRNVRAARHVVPVVDTPPEDGDGGDDEGGEVFKEAWRPGCLVEPAGDGGVRRVKIVMRRKDIAELVARLEQRDAAEIRNATVMEAAAELSAAGLGGVTMMSPCRDAWRPRLSIIPENY